MSTAVFKKSRLWDLARDASGEFQVSEDSVDDLGGRLEALAEAQVVPLAAKYAEADGYKTIQPIHMREAFDDVVEGRLGEDEGVSEELVDALIDFFDARNEVRDHVRDIRAKRS